MNRMEQRILRVWKAATPAQRKRGAAWYRDANCLCRTLSRTNPHLSVEQVAGILAALSPVCAWEVNVRAALALIRTERLPVEGTYPANRDKAYRILRGEYPARVLGGPKVKAFYACILRPHGGGAVVVDRHAASIATGQRYGNERAVRPGREYTAIATAYQRVARRVRQPVTTVQATTWVAYRDMLTPTECQHSIQWEG